MQDVPPAIIMPAPEVASADQGGIGPRLVIPRPERCPSAEPDEIVVCAPDKNEPFRLRPLAPLPPELSPRDKIIKALTVRIGPVELAPGGACGSFPVCISIVGPTPKPLKTINLVCLGAASTSRLEPTSGNIPAETINTIGRREIPFSDQVNIVLVEGKAGFIRLPRAMLPTLRGWTDGWFRLSEFQMTTEEVVATANISNLTGPRVRLDQLQGVISISGKSANYTGTCKPFEPVA